MPEECRRSFISSVYSVYVIYDEQIANRPLRNDAALLQHNYFRAELHNFIRVMADIKYRDVYPTNQFLYVESSPLPKRFIQA